jgi:carbamoyltransferase
MEGRCEFGPRALGHRSILADPRDPAVRDRVNAKIKSREGYRPFAPMILEEAVEDYFELPCSVASMGFMTVTLRATERAKEEIPGVVHVDGTARVQAVSRASAPRVWELLRAFQALTGVPVLLNTSFNVNAEPIVDSVDDGILCFLSTGLDALVIEDCFVSKKQETLAIDRLQVKLGSSAVRAICDSRGFSLELPHGSVYAISAELFRLLSAEGTIDRRLRALGLEEQRQSVLEEIWKLVRCRGLRLAPSG